MIMQCTREGVEEEHASWRQRKRSNGSTSLVFVVAAVMRTGS
ncbi:hypothetical protein ACHAWC_005535 [Mediolabrus comicus]